MLQGKVIIITGAATGIGQAAARRMAQEGARLILADVNAEDCAANERAIREAGGEALFVKTDISVEDEVRAMVDAATSTYGRLDGAFNNGAISSPNQLIHELDLEVWQRILAINLTGAFLCMKHEIAAMLESGGGSIVNTSSTAGIRAFPMIPAYCASKHGVIGLSRNAALDYGPRNVRVNVIAPGAVMTPMLRSTVLDLYPGAQKRIEASTPMGRISEPVEQAEAAIWLLSDAASYVSGTVVPVDGASTIS
jgi:NAD(P)-dependent dehydrogenase (short-subunit alcohol dehydrogenase family)